MTKLAWDQTGERQYETGTKKGVLYLMDDKGEYNEAHVWNGLTAVNESPEGAEATALYADDIKYLNLISAEDFKATIEAYMSPEAFDECDGQKEIAPGITIGQQKRRTFGFSFQTVIGNDVDGNEHGYKIHLIYGCTAAPSERAYATVNDSPEAMTLSWELTTTPVNVTGCKPTAHLEIDSTKVAAEKLSALEAILYGSEAEEARMPLPDEIITLVGAAG
jgi:hypothetical protein